MSKDQLPFCSDQLRMSPDRSTSKMSATFTCLFTAASSSLERHSLMRGATVLYFSALPLFFAKFCSCDIVGMRFCSETNRRKTGLFGFVSWWKISDTGTLGASCSTKRLSDFSSAATCSSGLSVLLLRLFRAKSLFRSRARSMMFRQCASLHSKPSLVMDSFFSIIRPMASSTGLPKKLPTCFCGDTLKCSSLQLEFARIPSTISRTAWESRLLDSRLSVRRDLLLRRETASSKPWAFMRLEFTRERHWMYVFVSMAFTSFGAMRPSMCGSGMCMLLKLKSERVGSLRYARCTIQIIQSPNCMDFDGSGSNSARSSTASIFAAKSLLMEPAT
mmetsp:Transcript_51807/g.150478  ORF Transcript_51807/g.150478 Transcript_51807/m.150478 type:complete len:332 (-) Transcript_51807:2069-3064(-)